MCVERGEKDGPHYTVPMDLPVSRVMRVQVNGTGNTSVMFCKVAKMVSRCEGEGHVIWITRCCVDACVGVDTVGTVDPTFPCLGSQLQGQHLGTLSAATA